MREELLNFFARAGVISKTVAKEGEMILSRSNISGFILTSALALPTGALAEEEKHVDKSDARPHVNAEQTSKEVEDLNVAVSHGAEAQPLYKYIGNSFSAKFHRPSCPFAKVMEARHIVLCQFRRDAVSYGMTPCRYCLPPFWLTVKAAIIPSARCDTTGNDSKVAKEPNAVPDRSLDPHSVEFTAPKTPGAHLQPIGGR